jgi:DNA polymerase III epsilon subunit family exonuclease
MSAPSQPVLPHDASLALIGLAPERVPSPSQRAAIEAGAEPLLVLAGPGAGKTFCLIERIRFLLERLELDPARICAFTFTNKAAGEIAERLARTLGPAAARVKTGTIHAFCAELLREFGAHVGIEKNFQIIDEKDQHVVLRRIGVFSWQKPTIARFSAYRIAGTPFPHHRDAELFAKYERFLRERNYADFDTLILKTAELLAHADVVERVRARWDCVLVDEFQDLNPLQYRVIRELGREHRHVFAVGDDEQSIYSWAGADPRVFRQYVNDFGVTKPIPLRENRRCSREILALARKLIAHNPTLFDEPKLLEAERDSDFCVSAFSFADDAAERAWLIDDLRRDRAEHGMAWGDVALLYRRHAIGEALEASFLSAGIPCRLANGRALVEDPVIAFVLASLRVVAHPDGVHDDAFFEASLSEGVLHDARARLPRTRRTLREELEAAAKELGAAHPDARNIRKACYTLDNLPALARQHATVMGLVEELLSHRVGTNPTVLEENHDELTDPAGDPEVVRLAERLADARDQGRAIWIERRRGADIPLRGLLRAARIGPLSTDPQPPDDAELILADDAPRLGLPLALFKAVQLLQCRGARSAFRDFTVVDIETTSKEIDRAEVVEIAAVRVRGRTIVDELSSLVKPAGAIDPEAEQVHGIGLADVAGAPSFAEVWPRVRAFCGDDVLVAHNGYDFDFPVLERLSGEKLLGTYDTLPLARKIVNGKAGLVALAARFGIDAGHSHRALDDVRTLAKVFLALRDLHDAFARKTALAHLLDHLAVALVLWPDELDPEGTMLRERCAHFAFGRFSSVLDEYEAQRAEREDVTLPSVQDLIEWLGGVERMERVRAEKSAEQRYPMAMARLRGLLDQLPEGSFDEQLTRLLELAALSRTDVEPTDATRVNLLTLHSTKGLEFSRVYVVGMEDAELIGGTSSRPATPKEVEEARRLVYVGMTRAKDRLVFTHARERAGRPAGGHRFLDEMGVELVSS